MTPLSKLKDAIIDMRYLLSRGYKREHAANFIASRYLLSKEERAILYRAVYDPIQAEIHKQKKVKPEFISQRILTIDGYNVLITIESAIRGRTLIICDDGFIRDISAVFGKYKITELTHKSINLILNFLSKYSPKQVLFFFDSPVSRSGELASLVRKYLKKFNLVGDAKAVKQSDKAVLKHGEVVATSDHVIIECAKYVLDLAGEIIKRHYPVSLITLN